MSNGWYGERVRWSKASALREFGEPDNIASAKKVANNTLLIETKDGRKVLRLHKTNIITRMPDGTVVLNSGGWLTVTTKNRICEFLPKFLADNAPYVYIHSDRGVWKLGKFEYLSQEGEPREYALPTHTKLSVFYDGMVLNPDGTPVEPRKDEGDEVRRLRRLLTKYTKMIREWKGALPVPSAGDCWICAARPAPEEPRSWDVSHLVSHLEEGYFHGSLLVNAMRSKGRPDTFIAFAFSDSHSSNFRSTVCRDVRSYFKKQLRLPLA